ncbi:MAG: hypothetical protein SOW31_06560, partial [Treponema sp.]|nr:hypothetical protein [Treponema sp.]
MKKATKFLLAAVLGLAAVFTTSCALEIVAPENKWVTYEYPVTTDGTTYVIRGYAYYTETPTKIKTYGDPLELPAGLTIVAAPKIVNGNESSFKDLFGQAVTDNSYAIKTFGKGEYVEYGESDKSETKQFKMSYTTWLILYNSIIHENISTGAPEILKDGKKLAIENVKWKKIIYY